LLAVEDADGDGEAEAPGWVKLREMGGGT